MVSLVVQKGNSSGHSVKKVGGCCRQWDNFSLTKNFFCYDNSRFKKMATLKNVCVQPSTTKWPDLSCSRQWVAILVPDDKLDCFVLFEKNLLRVKTVRLFIRNQCCHLVLMAPHYEQTALNKVLGSLIKSFIWDLLGGSHQQQSREDVPSSPGRCSIFSCAFSIGNHVRSDLM